MPKRVVTVNGGREKLLERVARLVVDIESLLLFDEESPPDRLESADTEAEMDM